MLRQETDENPAVVINRLGELCLITLHGNLPSQLKYCSAELLTN